MDERDRIAPLSDLADEGSLLITLRDGDRGDGEPETEAAVDDGKREAVVLRDGDDVVAWRNYCPHMTDVRLDKGSGATRRNGEIVCEKHGAMFEIDTGECTYGPCRGAYLDPVDVAIDEGAIYLEDDRYEFAHVGPSASDDNPSTGARLGFEGN